MMSAPKLNSTSRRLSVPKIIGLHIIPNPDTGCRHKPVGDCKCNPKKDSSVNPKVPIYTHNTLGQGKDAFKIKIQTDADSK